MIFRTLAFLKNFSRMALWIAGWAGGAVLLLVALKFYYANLAPFTREPFTQAGWQEAVQGETDYERQEKELHCLRGAMVKDLIYNHLDDEMSPRDVRSLLGKPLQRVERAGYRHCLAYALGSCHFGQKEFLLLCFDASNRLAAAKLREALD